VLWQLLALSRLVRSSLSFLPRLRGRGGRQNAIEDSVTGSLSGFWEGAVTISYNYLAIPLCLLLWLILCVVRGGDELSEWWVILRSMPSRFA
jgi:hypothetical protein